MYRLASDVYAFSLFTDPKEHFIFHDDMTPLYRRDGVI